jgi:AraC-like DNA-binding protein
MYIYSVSNQQPNMKPTLEQVPVCGDSSFLVREFNVPYFEAPLHFHPVCELTLITESKGRRFIGDHIGNFDVGDLVFIGSNVPHLYRCTEEYYQDDLEARARAIIIQFDENFLGKDFFLAPEMARIRQLLEQSTRGISFFGKTRSEVEKRMMKIRTSVGFEKLTEMLQILNILSTSEEYALLSRDSISAYNHKDNERMSRIYEYVMNNFARAINLKEMAEIVHMSEAAFCRYFKKKTRKTFKSFLNEIRIGHASKMLINDEYNVGQICYKCGFENLSNFNRQFKEITALSPLSYRQQFREQIPSTTEYLTL